MKLTKEITFYKKDAVKQDIIASSVKNYMTDLSNGVFIYAKGDPNNPENQNARGILIRDSIDIIRDGKVVSSFGEEIVFKADDNQPYVKIGQNGFEILNNIDDKPIANFKTENNHGKIVLGYEDDIHSEITSSKFSFKNGELEPLWLGYENEGEADQGNWEVYSETMHIENMLQFGDFAWIKRDNGNMTLKWIGSSESQGQGV